MTHLDPVVFTDYLVRTRWFAGKGRPFTVTGVRLVGEVPGRVEGSPHVVIHLVQVSYSDVEETAVDAVELYQVPLAFYEHPQQRLDHAFVGWWEHPEHGWVHAYDALHDREAMACWLRSFDAAASEEHGNTVDPETMLTFHRLPGYDLDAEAPSMLFTGEQSNSSVSFGEDALMKVFRKVTPGVNPDVAVHDVLTRAGSDHVAALYGWLDVLDADSDAVIQLAMLQQFLRTATDGWDLALGSVRSLFADPELHARESGGDFAGEATRLGEALRELHETLRESFGSSSIETGDLADQMRARLSAAESVVPGLAQHHQVLSDLHDRVAQLGRIEVHRIHGDLHLGQTLRTSKGWKVVDFEGEPAKPLAERMLPDSPWRDVAGMLRSFDYVPHVADRERDEEHDPEEAAQRTQRAQEWAHRARNHFLNAYTGGQMSDTQHTLLDAYVADKAVYETVYETRNRPTWVDIPLQAVARIGAA
ncbi:maltokinase N-terminal cap-like domain-containing protein [Nocardioides lijunqiniae]|uniref:maltokinase N-terminal cap-like domain-containing protein n=1 Tax=Nocardioides lijunqiniae TaxID=2760832 RepID=UPI0030B7FB09